MGYAEKVDVTSPTVSGFTPDKPVVSLDFASFTTDTDIEVVYKANTVDYLVEHLVENLARDGFELHKTETKQGKVEELVQASPIVIEGFTAQVPFQEAKIPVEGTLKLQVHYTRNVYQIT